MSHSRIWVTPTLALAVVLGMSGYNGAVAQNSNSGQQEKKQADQPAKESNSSGQADSQKSQSGSNTSSNNSGSQAGSTGNQSGSNQNAQPKTDSQSAGQDAKAGQSQQGTQSNQRAQTNPNTQGQAGANTRSNQTGQNANQNTQNANRNNQQPNNRDNQANNRDNQSRDNNKSQTNINVGIQFGAVNDRGLVINSVENNSFFFRAGLRKGDVIVSFSGRPIRSHDEFIEFITVHRGERIPVIVLRDGRQETVYVVYEEDALVPPSQPGLGNDQGAALLGVTFDAQIPNAAVVKEVFPGGAAAAAGIKQGDEIIMISGQRVTGLQNAVQVIGGMKAGDNVEIQYLQLKHAQVTLAAGGNRTASATAEVGVNTGVNQTDFQQNVQGQNNQNQNREAQSTQPNRNTNQNSGNRGGIVPRIRN